jgi:hypothetical protein
MCNIRRVSLSLALSIAIAAVGAAFSHSAAADDWPMLGRDGSRNAVSPEKNLPVHWQVEIKDNGTVTKKAKNVVWTAELGSLSRGGPVVADGLVWVGTNNRRPRDSNLTQDASVLMCFRESDGKFLYQYVSPRLQIGLWRDWPSSSMPAPMVEKDHLWLVTNRGRSTWPKSSACNRAVRQWVISPSVPSAPLTKT